MSVGQNKREKTMVPSSEVALCCICKGFEFLTHARVNQKGVSRLPKDEPQSLWKAVAPKKRPSMPCPKNQWFSPVQDATPLCSRTCFPDLLQCTGGYWRQFQACLNSGTTMNFMLLHPTGMHCKSWKAALCCSAGVTAPASPQSKVH